MKNQKIKARGNYLGFIDELWNNIPIRLTNVNGGESNEKDEYNAKEIERRWNMHQELLQALEEMIKTANPKDITSHKHAYGVDLGEYYVGGCGIPSDKSIHMATNIIKKGRNNQK